MTELTKVLGHEDILEAGDLKYEDVEVPEWGGVVRIRELTGVDRDKYEREVQKRAKGQSRKDLLADTVSNIDLSGLRSFLLSMSIVDDRGKLIFSDEGQRQKLETKSAVILDMLFDIAQKVSKLTDEDVKDSEKNLPTAPSGDSGSDSQGS